MMNMQKAYVGRNNTVTMSVYIDCTVVLMLCAMLGGGGTQYSFVQRTKFKKALPF